MSTIMAGVGIAAGLGNLYAQYRAGQRAETADKRYQQQMQQMLQGQRADISSLLGPAAYQNYMDSDAAQSLLEQARSQLQEQTQQIRGGVARSGGTTEAAVAGQTAATRGYADIINRMAGQGTQYQDQARQRLMWALQNLSHQKAGLHGHQLQTGHRRAETLSAGGQQMSGAFTDLASLFL